MPPFAVGGTQAFTSVSNGAYIGPATLYPGLTTPAKPGETITIYADGFGATNSPVQTGSVTLSGVLTPLPAVTIGGVPATVQFAGLVGPGEFQFNVVVPAGLDNGDQAIIATYKGASTQAGTLLTVHH
jgi:uncharacterized protein (TIGR03437 family)